MVTLACAFFEGSACGVTVTVTVLGFGGVTGAVYVAEVDTAPPPRARVVTTTSSPQLVPVHPAPESVQDSVVLGFEPGTGVSMAGMTLEPTEETLEGEESCREKVLVMVTVAKACFDGSATLCAVTVTDAGLGKNCGA